MKGDAEVKKVFKALEHLGYECGGEDSGAVLYYCRKPKGKWLIGIERSARGLR